MTKFDPWPIVRKEQMHSNWKFVEYEIKEFNTDLIEMETASLYKMADLLEIPTVALLVVSDNSATGAALVGRTDAEQKKYDDGRNVILPDMILEVAAMDRS